MRFQGCGDDRWRNRVRKQIRARALPQELDNLFAAAGETAASATKRFAERAGDDVDLAHDAAILGPAAPGFTQETGRMRVVDHGQRVVFFGKTADLSTVRDRSVHLEA